MDRIETMKAFISVYEEGGFTRAANKLDMSNQLVSKYVSDLEEHLGVRLFNRTTRSVSLTEAGEQCVQHVRQILERIQDMEGGLGQLKNNAQGLLRINAPISFSTKQIPLLKYFTLVKVAGIAQSPFALINPQLPLSKAAAIPSEKFLASLNFGKIAYSPALVI